MLRILMVIILVTGWQLASAPISFADSYRCGQKLIHVGDSASEVLRTCGEPRFKDRGEERIEVNGISKNTTVQRWYYKKSGRSLERVVLIYKGRVRGIQVGSR